MNHHIYSKENHKSKTPEPALTVQQGTKRIYCNTVQIEGPSVVKYGRMQNSIGHEVHGWLETESKVTIID